MSDLRAAAFDPSANKWKSIDSATENVARNTLTLATMNIWFGDFYATERYHAISDFLADQQPDFIALQEVTQDSLHVFLRQRWLRRDYYVSDIDGRTLGDYGVTIFSRHPLESLRLIPLWSEMGRHLLVAKTTVNDKPFHLATVHLESTRAMVRWRGKQLIEIFAELVQTDNVTLMGDFNFCASWQEENSRLDPAFTDVWGHLRPDEQGFTVDTSINHMRYQIKGQHKQVRFDRVLLKSERWSADSIDLIGTEPISPDDPDIFPSDHFGLLCELSVS